MKAILAVLFVVLAALAWVTDKSPTEPPRPLAQQADCIWWLEGKWQQVRCPR